MHQHGEMIQALRRLLDHVEATGQDLPYGLRGKHTIYVGSDELIEKRRELLPSGLVQKIFTDWDVGFAYDFGEGIQLAVCASRSAVCERVVVGKETVHHEAVEAKEAYDEEVEVTAWVCPDSVLAELSNE